MKENPQIYPGVWCLKSYRQNKCYTCRKAKSERTYAKSSIFLGGTIYKFYFVKNSSAITFTQ